MENYIPEVVSGETLMVSYNALCSLVHPNKFYTTHIPILVPINYPKSLPPSVTPSWSMEVFFCLRKRLPTLQSKTIEWYQLPRQKDKHLLRMHLYWLSDILLGIFLNYYIKNKFLFRQNPLPCSYA